ncbi:hypothetical protein EDD15DRAFT_349934 [Pisolithus albus]|nr:hypothetical protein EDD15DRAFT_349934 [Pisolithus albus]
MARCLRWQVSPYSLRDNLCHEGNRPDQHVGRPSDHVFQSDQVPWIRAAMQYSVRDLWAPSDNRTAVRNFVAHGVSTALSCCSSRTQETKLRVLGPLALSQSGASTKCHYHHIRSMPLLGLSYFHCGNIERYSVLNCSCIRGCSESEPCDYLVAVKRPL